LDVEIGAVCVKKLGKLSPPEAIAMVQQMTRGKVTEEQAAQLAQLCGYLPLAVQVVSATLAKQSNLRPEAMIQRLTENKVIHTRSLPTAHCAYPELLTAITRRIGRNSATRGQHCGALHQGLVRVAVAASAAPLLAAFHLPRQL
jgi:hypothetical protein